MPNLKHFVSHARTRIGDALGRRYGAITHVATQQSVAALTFDDGPDPVYTPRLLDVLRTHHAKATFFMVGRAASKYPEIVRLVADGGHSIGNHSWDHAALPYVRTAERLWQMRACRRAIAPYGGTRLFRPPYGKQTVASHVEAMLLGYKIVAWNAVAGDWRDDPADLIAERMASQIRPGSILLFHDALYTFGEERFIDRAPTIDAVDALLKRMEGTYQFVTVPELLKLGRPQRKNWYGTPDRRWLAGLTTRTL
jgi:peptidoglycan-N-acetylglucosamine deacetylase